MAQRLAAKGYAVLVPNGFDRSGRAHMFDFKLTMGEERTMKRFAELRGPVTPEAMERDASAYVDFLARQDGVRPGPLAVVGYCFTGAMALRTAAVRPEQIAAAASFHGGGLYTDAATSPHLVLPRVKAQLYFGHAIQDRGMPEEAISKRDQALVAWGGRFESEVHPGAYHRLATLGRPVHNQAQAGRALTKLNQLLAQTLREG